MDKTGPISNHEKIELATERLEKLDIEIEKIENQEYLKIAIDMVREKLELEIIREVKIEELKKLELEILENLEKPKKLEKLEKLKLKQLRKLNKLEVEIESIKRLEIKRIVKEFHELANDSNIELRIESKKTILSIAEYINNRKNFKIEPIDSSLKGKCIGYCPELPSGILSPCSYLNIKKMNIIFSDKKK